MESPIDISSYDLEMVKSILHRYVPEYEVWAFGSRVMGKPRPFSDLDLVIITEKRLDPLRMASLREEFSESALPFKVDLLDWSAIQEHFRKIIAEKKVVIQTEDRENIKSPL